MGSVLHSSGSLCAEIAHRCTSFVSAYRPIAGKVFRNNLFTEDVRAMHSLLMSRLLYNIGGAHRVTSTDVRKVSAQYMRVCRDIAKMRNTAIERSGKPDREVLKHLGLPTMSSVIRVNRLRFLGRLLRTDVPFALHLCALSARSEGSWPSLVSCDFSWLRF